MTTRQLVSETPVARTYRVLDDDGNAIGEDVELILSPDVATRGVVARRAEAALAANTAYLALPSPSAVQVTQQVGRLTRECSALIRLLLGRLDSDEGT